MARRASQLVDNRALATWLRAGALAGSALQRVSLLTEVYRRIISLDPAQPSCGGPYPNSRYYEAFFFAADRFTFLPFWTHTLREGS